MSVVLAGFDWQFVIVTLAALGGACVLLRPLLPARRSKSAGGAVEVSTACGGCSKCALHKAAVPPSK